MTDYIASVSSLPDGSDWVLSREVDTSSTIVEIHSILAEGSCDVYYEHDPDADGNYEVSILIGSLSSGITQNNNIEVSMKRNARLRIVNTSGGSADYAATGDIIE